MIKMGKASFIFLAVILFMPFMSAEVIIQEQPEDLYNLGEVISVPIKITSSLDAAHIFNVELICNGVETEVYKEFISIKAGEEKLRTPEIPLIKSFIGESKGICKVKASLGEEYVLTHDFKISDLININLDEIQKEAAPEEKITIGGNALKENGESVEGLVELSVIDNKLSEKISRVDTVKSGQFSITFTFPKNAKSGQYLIKLKVYEKEGLITTNNGFVDYNLFLTQIPTSLELSFDNKKVVPGTNLLVKAVLHDQTGEKIKSTAVITVKDWKGKVIEQSEKQTDEFLEIPIAYNEPSNNWTVSAVSGELNAESGFLITENKKIKIELINKTLKITNVGNVPYEKNILVKVGGNPVDVNVNLGVDESKNYLITAPDGEYEIDVINDGESQITGRSILTGDVIGIKESSRIISFVRYPFVWIFIVGILGFVTFMFLKKGYKRSFFGHMQLRKKEHHKTEEVTHHTASKNSLINSKDKAELSMSHKGDKQEVSVVCLKIKNFNDINSKKDESVKGSMQKISTFVENEKASIYENNDTIFFILAPAKTRTFKNNMASIKIAEKIKEILLNHNRLFKQKIEFGISLNHGAMIATYDAKQDILKFMSLGTLITNAKKLSSISDGEIFLGEKMKEKTMTELKTEKHKKDGVEFYTITEIKHKDNEENRKFISDFIRRLEKK